MIYLRSTLFTIYLSIFTIIFGVLSGFLLLLPLKWRWAIIVYWNRAIIWGAKVICGIRYEVKGLENIPDQAAIYLSKHQSAWETIFFPTLFKRSLTYVHKKELNYIPFFGWGLASVQQIAIDRSAGRDAMAQVMEKGKKRLDDDRNVVIFPEGTRMPVGETGRYKLGGARLAVHTQYPVVPVALNAGMCWPRQSFLKKPGVITVSIGPAISPAGLSTEELNQQVENWIEAEMRVLNPEVYADKLS
ncbi:MAG: lysophospholipid acyltransferase family protein [Pelistega sp.]|nr:lysophospholipid acyltransferase family protein [Pelistega sp.]